MEMRFYIPGSDESIFQRHVDVANPVPRVNEWVTLTVKGRKVRGTISCVEFNYNINVIFIGLVGLSFIKEVE